MITPEEKIFTSIIAAFLVLFCVSLAFLEETLCLIKHQTLTSMPPNYALVHNGAYFNYRTPSGSINSFRTYKYRRQAVANAWEDYDYETKEKRKYNPNWKVVE